MSAINPDDIKVIAEEDGYTISVDDETDTYATLVSIGKENKPDATEQEAFELALKLIIKQYVKP